MGRPDGLVGIEPGHTGVFNPQRITNIRKDKAIVSSILIKERLRFMLSQVMATTELKNPSPN